VRKIKEEFLWSENINDDGKSGLEEAIHALQVASVIMQF